MKKTSIITAVALVASFGLVGCGGGGSGSESSTTTVQGTAVDPELVGSIVCVDNNGDNICDGVSVQTGMNGTYSIALNTSDLQAGVTLLVQGGYDRVTKMPFVGTMKTMVIESTATAQQMITPLTTLVYERAVELQGDVEQAQEDVAALLGLTVDELRANMMQLAEDGEAEALQAALAMQQAAELAAGDTNDTRAFYQAMAGGMPDSQGNGANTLGTEEIQSDLAALMIAVAEDSNLSDVEKLHVKYFAQAMDEMGAVADPELYAMGVEKMQEMISHMDNMDMIIGEVSSFVTGIMDSLDNVEAFVTTYLLERAGVVQDVIDQVVPVIIAHVEHAEITITADTGFTEMISIMERYEADIVTALGENGQVEYNTMIIKMNEIKNVFEGASQE